VREKYYWLVAGGWFVLREKYRWLVADKPNERAAGFNSDTTHWHCCWCSIKWLAVEIDGNVPTRPHRTHS
jgi:hypothetical protein